MMRPLLAALAAVAVAACTSPAPADAPPSPTPEPTAAAFGPADIPVAPGHFLREQCPFEVVREFCVSVPGEVSRNDEAAEQRLVDDYAKRFEAAGWQSIAVSYRPVVMKPGPPPRCLRLEAVMWDDGRAARIRYQLMLRVQVDPEGVACAAPAAQ